MDDFRKELLEKLAQKSKYVNLNYEVLITEYNLTLTEAYVYSFIYGLNKSGLECKLSQQKIADTLGLSLKTIKRTLKNLVDKGFLTCRYGKCSSGLMCTYHI